MSIGLLCEYLETDEMGIKLTAESMGINLTYIPFRKVSVGIDTNGFNFKSKIFDHSNILNEVKVVLNRAQSKNRRLLAASFMETIDKKVINSLSIEFSCFSKFRTLLKFWKNKIKVPRTVFIPCDVVETTKNGKEIHNEEYIADLIMQELEDGVVIKPDAGTHGKDVKLAEKREELIKILEEITPSIINPIGVLAQAFVQKWFYDLRIIVFKEKGKPPYCYPKAMARAGFRDFRTNTALGNFVFDVDLPDCIRDLASECGAVLSEGADAWLLALDAMINFEEVDNFSMNNEYVVSQLAKLETSFEEFKKVKRDPMKKKDFYNWNRKLEEAFLKYKSSEAYHNIRNIINESVEKGKHSILF
ncbi:hypothetical protein H5T51_09630, partial [Candidatus Bathyarchaeota archaeon]|nr:hypothetical protein [Candidatus Bathyarchaeota archaeon]